MTIEGERAGPFKGCKTNDGDPPVHSDGPLVGVPFHRVGWVYEEKVDGYRILAYKDNARVRLVSRNGVDHTRRYTDGAAAVARLRPSTLVLDGELAVFDERLRSRFDSVVATPPVLIAFDVPYVKGRDVRQRPLRERRARLEDVVAGAGFIYPVGRLAPDGLEAWAEVVERDDEGLVAKDEASAYESGRTMHRSALAMRVGGFHAALTARDSQNVWEFLGPGLKKDDPKDEYVGRLKARIAKWDLDSVPDVSFRGQTKKDHRPIGKAFSKVNVRTPDGQLVPIVQETTWLWFNERGREPAWYLAQEMIRERN